MESKQNRQSKSELLIPTILTCGIGWVADSTQTLLLLMVFMSALVVMFVRFCFLPKNLKDWFLGVFVVCFAISLFTNHLPAVVTFKLAQSTLEEARHSLLADEPKDTPFYAGCYRIHKLERLGSDDSGFWFSDSKFGNRHGFIFSEDENLRFNSFGETKVAENWYLVTED